ncbi:MAG: insulinase family protein [Terriglobia bacterium]
MGIVLLALSVQTLVFAANPLMQSKPAVTRPAQAPSPGVTVIGPFTSREDSDEYTKVVLKNGLTAVIFERQDVPLTSLTLYVRAGALHELSNQIGAAPLSMHAVCLAKNRSTQRQVAAEISQFGGTLEGKCFPEYTRFTVVVPASSVRKGIELESEAIKNPALEEDKGTDLNALARLDRLQTFDSPEQYGWERLDQLVFPMIHFPSSSPREQESAETLSPQELQKFFHRWYTARNLILVICGSVDRRQALEEVVKRFGEIGPGQFDTVEPPQEPPQSILRSMQLRGVKQQAYVFLGFQGPRPFTGDWYACKLLEGLLAEGDSSKLNWALREEQGVACLISHRSLELRQRGEFGFAVMTNPKQVQVVETTIFIELAKIRAGQFEDVEIEKAKNLLERRFFLDQEEVSSQAAQLARFEDISRFSEWKGYINKIRSVSRAEIVRAARQYFQLSKANLVEYFPSNVPLRDMNQLDLQNSLEKAVQAKVQTVDLSEQREEEEPKPPKPSKPGTDFFYRKPSGELTSAWVNYELKSYSVLRGPEVLVKQSQALPIIALGVFYPGGRSFEQEKNFGITSLMLRVSARETLRQSSFKTISGIETHGARLQTIIDRDLFGYLLTGTKSEFEQTLDGLASVLRDPRFDDAQIERQKLQVEFENALLEDKITEFAASLFQRSNFGNRPYGWPVTGNTTSLGGITKADLVEWHDQWVRNVRPIIVIAGDTDGSDIVSALTIKLSLAGSHQMDLPPQSEESLSTPLGDRVVKKEQHHSCLVWGATTPPVTSQRILSMAIANEFFQGAGSKLVENLNQSHLVPVHVQSRYEPGWLGSSLGITFTTVPGMQERLAAVIQSTLLTLKSEPVSDADWRRALNLSATHLAQRWQSREYEILDFAKFKNVGMDVETIRDFQATQQELRKGELQDALRSLARQKLIVAGVEGQE